MYPLKLYLPAIFLFFNILQGYGSAILEQELKKIKSIKRFEKIGTTGGFNACYLIYFEQPIDHHEPAKGYFLQKIYLSHKAFDKPTLLNINGYISSGNTINEWSDLLDANQVYVEHRFFGESKPANITWETLNLKNACNDLHNIRTSFNSVYSKSWISTGISKGGLTAVSYKYFYPNDVNATIALSTSVKLNPCDTTFFSYIDSLCREYGCFEELKAFQKKLLINKDKLLPLLKEYFHLHNKKYDYLGLTRVFETAVLEIPFSIWQNNNGCNTVQYFETETVEKLFKSFRNAIHGWFLTDDVFIDIDAYHYQAMTELGYYCYPTHMFKEYLNTGGGTIASVVQPGNTTVNFSNELMKKIGEWLTHSGDNIIYISGSNDPYSIYKIVPDKKLNSLSIVLPNRNHNQVHFKNLDLNQKKEVMARIRQWIN